MKQTEEIPYIPVQTGEVFLQDKIVDDTHCYICRKNLINLTIKICFY